MGRSFLFLGLTVQKNQKRTQKFIAYFDLRDAFGEEGCPICHLLAKRSFAALDSLLYEQVTDPITREQLRNAHGFCNWHAWTLTRILTGQLGVAIIYEDLLGNQIEHLQALRKFIRPPSMWERLKGLFVQSKALPFLAWRRKKSSCPICSHGSFNEASYLRTLLDFLAELEFARNFERSFGLCLPHLFLAVEQDRDHPNIGILLDLEMKKLKDLRWELKEFIRKHDYRFASEPMGKEGTSWRRAIELFTGKPDVFGNERFGIAPRDIQMILDEFQQPSTSPSQVSPEGGERETEPGREALLSELEQLRFENEKLKRRIDEIIREWSKESSRAASLHYQMYKLSEDLKVLKLNLAGAQGESQGWKQLVKHLREEIQRLKGQTQKTEEHSEGKGRSL